MTIHTERISKQHYNVYDNGHELGTVSAITENFQPRPGQMDSRLVWVADRHPGQYAHPEQAGAPTFPRRKDAIAWLAGTEVC